MRKRLRKKKRVGEFQELCFELRAELRSDLDNAELEGFVDRLIDTVEARKLSFGGGAGRNQ
ncbi:MAG TPA: 50S ribosome-binding protein YggL, partial [Polyangiales bacterium]|nr:50S ribosome-binding protein YggL [Polyangiales bacterium]